MLNYAAATDACHTTIEHMLRLPGLCVRLLPKQHTRRLAAPPLHPPQQPAMTASQLAAAPPAAVPAASAASGADAAAAGAPAQLPLNVRVGVQEMRQLLADYDCWVFDLDGTLWRGDQLIKGALESLELLRSLGKQVLYMTNNSMKSRAAYLAKFERLGVPAELASLYCSSYSAAAYLDSIGFDRSKKVYVVGEQGIIDELAAVGIAAFGGPADNDSRCSFSSEMEHDPQVGAVVCGVDPGLNYYKIKYASLCILQNPGCLFIATNADARGHFSPNQESPGAGATVGAIKAVVEREPVITGKPSPFLMADIAAKHNVQPARSIMVGDRLDTDIAWGRATGMATLLVLTGVTDEALLEAHAAGGCSCSKAGGGSGKDATCLPHFWMASFGELVNARQQLTVGG